MRDLRSAEEVVLGTSALRRRRRLILGFGCDPRSLQRPSRSSSSSSPASSSGILAAAAWGSLVWSCATLSTTRGPSLRHIGAAPFSPAPPRFGCHCRRTGSGVPRAARGGGAGVRGRGSRARVVWTHARTGPSWGSPASPAPPRLRLLSSCSATSSRLAAQGTGGNELRTQASYGRGQHSQGGGDRGAESRRRRLLPGFGCYLLALRHPPAPSSAPSSGSIRLVGRRRVRTSPQLARGQASRWGLSCQSRVTSRRDQSTSTVLAAAPHRRRVWLRWLSLGFGGHLLFLRRPHFASSSPSSFWPRRGLP